jgi:hypothetical protein
MTPSGGVVGDEVVQEQVRRDEVAVAGHRPHDRAADVDVLDRRPLGAPLVGQGLVVQLVGRHAPARHGLAGDRDDVRRQVVAEHRGQIVGDVVQHELVGARRRRCRASTGAAAGPGAPRR